MNWYPWLNQPYRQIIARHQQGQAHHALLLQAINGMGDDALVWGVSRWLMCQQPVGLKSCGVCHGCQLMQAATHPDWYRLEAEKGKASLGIDAVRDVSEKLYHFAQQGGAKIVWLPDATQLTEAAANALLKTLEEPPANCWFFLSVQEPSRLLATLRSRCLRWHLAPPEEGQSLQWLQRQQPQPEAMLRAALRLSNGAPAAALALLQPDRWQARQTLCETLQVALQGDVLQLLPALNSDDVADRLSWLIALLVDAMKLHQGAANWLSNADRPDVVAQLAQQFNSSALAESTQQWILCREQLLHVASLNRELILTDRLLAWGRLLSPAAGGEA
ncbi:DNA polymerase III subunit delta' [Candidatus Pantoea soli]|uniref:DNA polymerase III subunit delta' n=1 Tax=Candidatus Pantoea soli TaxID=3098669 RepID=A0A518XC41_9GAMM|nr:DNA polymerase III subunit delta' [Pantoea soli]QDY41646.1 DNA polymerase III subunit delta' [Pantoea soli]